MKLYLHVMSDLHKRIKHPANINFTIQELPEGRDNTNTILVVAGDFQEFTVATMDWLSQYQDRYLKIVFVPGNHDFWDCTINTAVKKWSEVIDRMGYNIALLHSGQCFEHENLVIVGATLWTSMNNGHPLATAYYPSYMNDAKYIRVEPSYGKFLAADWIKQHVAHKKAIENVLLSSDKNIVVVTHHAPLRNSVNEKYLNEQFSNHYYYTDLSELFYANDKLRYWIHGHMHDCSDYIFNNTRVVCNPFGYGMENPYFNPMLLLEVDA